MATTVIASFSDSSFHGYQGTSGTGTGYIGYYNSTNYVALASFTPNESLVARQASFEIANVSGGDVGQIAIVAQVSRSYDEFINANGPQGSSTGRGTGVVRPWYSGAGVGYANITFDTPMQLYAGTTYYLWAYPNGTGYNVFGRINNASLSSADGAYLDLNGMLDGTSSGNISGYGTCDIYIDGNRVGQNVADWYQYYPNGTTYSIQNIQANQHKEYAGSTGASLSGTIGTTIVICRLSFNTKSYTITAASGTDFVTVSGGGSAKYGSTVTLTATVGSKTGATTSFDGWYNSSGTRVSTSLSYTVTVSGNATYTARGSYTWNDYYFDLNGWLDGLSSGGIQNYGTCDIYINNVRVAQGVSDHYKKYQYGSSYEVKNIQPVPGHTYVGVHSGSLTGTIGASTTNVVLAFDTMWYTVTFNGNGGTPGVSSKSVKYNTTYGDLPGANMDTCQFVGWFTSPNGGTQIFPGTAFTRTSGITLYAQWSCNGSINTYHSGQYRNYYIYIYHNGQWIRYAPYIYKSGSYVLHP